MCILVIGASGQLGRALCEVFSTGHQVVGTAHRHTRSGQVSLDLADAESTLAVLEERKPALILLAGAMCNVDLCELEPETCRRVNVLGPRLVAEYALRSGSHLVFFSTDQVFDGTQESYKESDPVGPLNTYARSKAESEAFLRETLPGRHLIIRMAWLYGPDMQRRNFALRLVDRMATEERVAVPADQWGSPTYTEDLARATRFLVEHGHTGTFHATGPELIDRVLLARRVCAHFGLDESHIVPTPTSGLGQAARRPLRVRLHCRKLEMSGAERFSGVDAGLEALRARHEARH